MASNHKVMPDKLEFIFTHVHQILLENNFIPTLNKYRKDAIRHAKDGKKKFTLSYDINNIKVHVSLIQKQHNIATFIIDGINLQLHEEDTIDLDELKIINEQVELNEKTNNKINLIMENTMNTIAPAYNAPSSIYISTSACTSTPSYDPSSSSYPASISSSIPSYSSSSWYYPASSSYSSSISSSTSSYGSSSWYYPASSSYPASISSSIPSYSSSSWYYPASSSYSSSISSSTSSYGSSSWYYPSSSSYSSPIYSSIPSYSSSSWYYPASTHTSISWYGSSSNCSSTSHNTPTSYND
ncbi:unnamed protein product [Adineta steineri]|uniref:Uncharacterized protein n=1 Tax=Adineta steineri TaxID=433720 RepID=A0A814U351_9BILA|nr:unnamed protein product [Adineta steineri]CAF1393408.1 unnamed protein product [Adineta steineri]